jgi:hypothetical protein
VNAGPRPADDLRDRFVVEPIGDEGLLFDLATGGYFRLNATATSACLVLQQSASSEDAVAGIAARFGLPVEPAAALLAEVRAQLATSSAPAVIQPPRNRLQYRRHPAGYALELNGTPVLATDTRGDELRLLAAPDAVALPLVQCVKAMTPKLLHLRGATVLHASACAIGDGVTAFSGESGAGKTTTARAMASAGARLVCEDLLVFRAGGAQPRLFVGAETRALAWTDEAAARLARAPQAAVDCAGLDDVASGPELTLAAIWFLDAGRRLGGSIQRRPLSTIEGVLALLTNNFLGGADAASCGRHLRETSRIAQAVSRWEVSMPAGLEPLAAAARAYAANSAS